MPTPCLSFATRYLKCDAGVMVTASHNPAEYNGYKVYGSDGCQITSETAKEIIREIEKIDIFTESNNLDFEKGIESGIIKYISEDVLDEYIKEVKKLSLQGDEALDKNIRIVYSPLNGTGLEPVTRVLSECGYNINVIESQKYPDGSFPTCPYPNPEIPEAMELGIRMAEEISADLMFATDPDCDRVGMAIRTGSGEYKLLTGNEVGVLLLDYICNRRIEMGIMPDNPVMIKTIVTTDMAYKIADNYGVKTIDLLTGFKYIGEKIGELEKEGKADSYIFGFEESCGYLSGTHVRDKDGVNAALMVCEMAAYLKAQGKSIEDRLEELYLKYGRYISTLKSVKYEGPDGMKKMQEIMDNLRGGNYDFGDREVVKVLDYSKGIDGLPKSNVLKFVFKDGGSVTIRPSGTEPKMKEYGVSVKY